MTEFHKNNGNVLQSLIMKRPELRDKLLRKKDVKVVIISVRQKKYIKYKNKNKEKRLGPDKTLENFLNSVLSVRC